MQLKFVFQDRIRQEKRVYFIDHAKDQPLRFIVWTHEWVRASSRILLVTWLVNHLLVNNYRYQLHFLQLRKTIALLKSWVEFFQCISQVGSV